MTSAFAVKPTCGQADISNEFADGYAHGAADFEGHRAKTKTEREMGGSIRKLLRALKLRG